MSKRAKLPIRCACLIVLAALSILSCKNDRVIDLFGKITFVSFEANSAGDGYSVRRTPVSFRKGSAFTKRDNEGLFRELGLDQFNLSYFFMSSDGTDLARSGEYADPMSPPTSKIGDKIHDLTAYFFTEDLTLYAYYDFNAVPVEGISFARKYQNDVYFSSDDITIEAVLTPVNPSNKKIHWSVSGDDEAAQDERNKALPMLPNDFGTSTDLSVTLTGLRSGRFKVTVTTDETHEVVIPGGSGQETIAEEPYSSSCYITIKPLDWGDVRGDFDFGARLAMFEKFRSGYSWTWSSSDTGALVFDDPSKGVGRVVSAKDGVVVTARDANAFVDVDESVNVAIEMLVNTKVSDAYVAER